MTTYACGGWMAKNPIPDDKRSYSTFTQLRDTGQAVLRQAVLRQAVLRQLLRSFKFFCRWMDGELLGCFAHQPSSPFTQMSVILARCWRGVVRM